MTRENGKLKIDKKLKENNIKDILRFLDVHRCKTIFCLCLKISVSEYFSFEKNSVDLIFSCPA